MKAIYIKNGRVIDPAKKIDGVMNVLVENGKISSLSTSKRVPKNVRVIEAKGSIVAPGFIDMHCHLRDPGEEYKEDIESGSLAAAAGGFTTICCMPNTKPVNDCTSVTDYIYKRARESAIVNVLPIGAITHGLKGEGLSDIGDLAKAGVIGISDDGRPVMNAAIMRRAMEYASTFNVPIIIHAEDLNLRGKGVMHEGITSTELGLRGIPSAAEEVMIARDIFLCGLTGSRLHIAHVSTAGGVELVREAKRLKLPVTCEVTPHHLTLTDQTVHGYDSNTKVNPPLRSETDRKELIAGLADGTIDAIATDHAPHDITSKELGFEESAFGIVGLETALPLSLKLVHNKKITLRRMVELFSKNPARIFDLKGKGSLAVGNDADIVIFNQNEPITVKASEFKSKGKNTPFNGWHLRGRVLYTIVGGNIAYNA